MFSIINIIQEKQEVAVKKAGKKKAKDESSEEEVTQKKGRKKVKICICIPVNEKYLSLVRRKHQRNAIRRLKRMLSSQKLKRKR